MVNLNLSDLINHKVLKDINELAKKSDTETFSLKSIVILLYIKKSNRNFTVEIKVQLTVLINLKFKNFQLF